jgi:steroid 5-alpha reductase family enzyme
MPLAHLLIQNALISTVCFLGLWLVSIRLKDVTLVDGYWPLGMVVLAGASFASTGPANPHKLLLLALCAAWGVRLGAHLLLRWRREGPDRRYLGLLDHARNVRGWSFAKASLLFVFATQAPLQFVVCLPVQLGQAAPTAAPLGPLAWTGLALGMVGIGFEAVGDRQLVRFKADPDSHGKVLDTGLWRYTRHPNYFGDACLWWGLYLVAAETRYGAWALPGPLLLTWTLMKWSGAPTVEGRLRETRPGYADYIARTSGFVPWPPKPRTTFG